MKCWDPECQNRAKKARSATTIFDRYGWALLDRRNMGVIDATTCI
jgi:hypothetical protein